MRQLNPGLATHDGPVSQHHSAYRPHSKQVPLNVSHEPFAGQFCVVGLQVPPSTRLPATVQIETSVNVVQLPPPRHAAPVVQQNSPGPPHGVQRPCMSSAVKHMNDGAHEPSLQHGAPSAPHPTHTPAVHIAPALHVVLPQQACPGAPHMPHVPALVHDNAALHTDPSQHG